MTIFNLLSQPYSRRPILSASRGRSFSPSKVMSRRAGNTPSEMAAKFREYLAFRTGYTVLEIGYSLFFWDKGDEIEKKTAPTSLKLYPRKLAEAPTETAAWPRWRSRRRRDGRGCPSRHAAEIHPQARSLYPEI